jgi:hypothetical protein
MAELVGAMLPPAYLECKMIEPNGELDSHDEIWVNLGIVAKLDGYRHLWCKVPAWLRERSGRK